MGGFTTANDLERGWSRSSQQRPNNARGWMSGGGVGFVESINFRKVPSNLAEDLIVRRLNSNFVLFFFCLLGFQFSISISFPSQSVLYNHFP